MITMPSIEVIAHGVETVTFIVAAIKGFRVLDRFYNLFKDFPPHRHVGRDILYPKGYSPEKMENINGNGQADVAGRTT